MFGRDDLAALPEPTLRAVVAELGTPPLRFGEELPTVVELLAAAGVVTSKSAGRRAIEEGGAYLNNAKVTDPDARLTPADLLHGKYVVVRRGRKTVGALALDN